MSEAVYREVNQRSSLGMTIITYEAIEPNPLDEIERLRAELTDEELRSDVYDGNFRRLRSLLQDCKRALTNHPDVRWNEVIDRIDTALNGKL